MSDDFPSPQLSSLQRCFQGVFPSPMSTCAADGTPNVTFISQVYYVDKEHVALSCQFFNKTQENILQNPFAQVELIDPVTFETYVLELRYEHSETGGPLFDLMSTRIQAIASRVGMTGIFQLRSSDVYRVLSLTAAPGYLLPEEVQPDVEELRESPPSLRSELRALALVTQRLRNAADLDALFNALFRALNEGLGFEHVMILMLDESGERLYTVAGFGYGQAGIGAEVRVGSGLIGAVAEHQKTVRVSHVEADLSYGRAIRNAAQAPGSEPPNANLEIKLPGLPDARSQIAIPLVAQGRLLGVLAVESRSTLGFEDWHESFLDIVGGQVASALETAMQNADEEAPPGIRSGPPPTESEQQRTRHFCFYRNDDCVFVDGEYLVRNVPGRILWKILKSYAELARTDFNNRELRLDPSLGLPQVKDNLESRLILLRKRLEQKCPDLRMVSKARGQFRLEVACKVELAEKDSA